MTPSVASDLIISTFTSMNISLFQKQDRKLFVGESLWSALIWWRLIMQCQQEAKNHSNKSIKWKLKRRQKLGEGKNLEEVNIRKRQKFREEYNSEESKNMEETKIRRSQLEDQEEAKNQRIPNFSLCGPEGHWLKEGLLFPLHTKPTIPFQGYAQC